MNPSITTITLTLGDQAENHVGMQKIGKMAKDGFSVKELKNIASDLRRKKGVTCEVINLCNLLDDKCDEAAILIIRDGVNALFDDEDCDESAAERMFNEQATLDVDKKAFMYGRVVNKKARHNLCFAEEGQEPDYENGQGRIVPFSEVPMLQKLRDKLLPETLGDKASGLAVEGNYYYDVKKCFIGFHGDSERRRVVAIRLGSSFNLYYQWYFDSKPVGKRLKVTLDNGDMYVMSEKAVGTDWKIRSIYTLRHAAGSEKALKLT